MISRERMNYYPFLVISSEYTGRTVMYSTRLCFTLLVLFNLFTAGCLVAHPMEEFSTTC